MFIPLIYIKSLIQSTYTSGNSNTSVSDEFFCAFFTVRTEKYQFFLCVSLYTDRKIQKRTEKLHDFSVRDNSHTEKIYTHRKMLIFLTVFLKLTEKYYTHTEKMLIILWVYIKRTEKRNTHRIKETCTLILT